MRKIHKRCNMTIEKYETLLKVVELGSLTRAAEELGCTQSAISHMLNKLEEELGFTVITRSKAGAKLTADGEKSCPRCAAYSTMKSS